MRCLPSATFDSRASTTGVGWGNLAPAWKGGSGATRILRSKRPSVSGPWNAGCGGVGLRGEKRRCFCAGFVV